MECHYYDANVCRSCTLIRTPYAQQLSEKQRRCAEQLPMVDPVTWLPAVASPESGFRNRVKLVVGSAESGAGMTLGILGPDQRGVDLRECAIQAPEIAAVIPAIAEMLETSGLPPYDVPERRGELKFVHVTVSPAGEMMLRFVGRTQHTLDVLRARLAQIRAAVPQASVITVNLLPEHRAALEGEREEVLFGESLRMAVDPAGEVSLNLLPGSFFQTNTAVTAQLYGRVSEWVAERRPASLWDLYCGVGGFALHCAHALGADHSAEVLGVEVSAAAVRAAERTAADSGITASFVAGDATEFALAASAESTPEALIVNPPRRGIGEQLAHWIEGSGVPFVIYSSCNPESLARDLARMPAYRVTAAQAFDMFPHTGHLEVAVRLERAA